MNLPSGLNKMVPPASAPGPWACLDGLRVVDLTTLLPGPLASLMLSECGADVIKIERPPLGDDMRHMDGTGTLFKLLNTGKRAVMADLKNPADKNKVLSLITSADILIEQFRPGVMNRLGLDYDTLSEINPGLIYCSISGFGQTGALSGVAGHDLNYIAAAGLLGLGARPNGDPVIPPALLADIAGGSYPAVMNILLAVIARYQTGRGCYLDVAMTDNVFTFMASALAGHLDGVEKPQPGSALLTGGSPRYQIYRTADDRHLAVAALEEKFWQNFCDLIDLPEASRSPDTDQKQVIEIVQNILASRPVKYWSDLFDGKDVCCNTVAIFDEVQENPHFSARGMFVNADRLPLPIAACFQDKEGAASKKSECSELDNINWQDH